MRLELFPPDYYLRPNLPPIGEFGWRMLAEGDSWFTVGTFNVFAASNLLYGPQLSRDTVIVNCAYPGDTLKHMVEAFDDPYFGMHLHKPGFAMAWDAILISGGGNDLIDAAAVPAIGADGQPTPQDRRLLLTAAEVAATGNAFDPLAYISDGGWARLQHYLVTNFREIVRWRSLGAASNSPIFCHTYAVPTVRPSGTLGSSKGWLFPSFEKAGIDVALRQPICNALFGRLRALLLSLDSHSGSPRALPQFRVFDSAAVSTVVAAQPSETGSSGDWVNEIHLTPQGYKTVGAELGSFIDAALLPT